MDYWLHQYREIGDATSLLVPIDIALDWHRYHVQEGRASDFQWYDHSTGVRASRLAFLLDLILRGDLKVGEDDFVRLMTLADLHVEKLKETEFFHSGNHSLSQLVGLDALCSVVSRRDACKGARPYARSELARLVKSWFSDEGVHLESSPTYHGWVIERIRSLGAAKRFRYAEVEDLLELADTVSPWLTYPDGRWVTRRGQSRHWASAGRGCRASLPLKIRPGKRRRHHFPHRYAAAEPPQPEHRGRGWRPRRHPGQRVAAAPESDASAQPARLKLDGGTFIL